MKRNDLAYLAGFFDGEGCISISHSCKGKYISLNCYVATKGEYMPRLFQFHFGGSVRRHNLARGTQVDHWKWHIAAIKASEFLKAIYPYLKLKEPQADLAIAFQTRVTQQKRNSGNPLDNKEKALREAELILMRKMKQESYQP